MKFVLDHMLGKLAKWLRILGYDTIYYKGNDIKGLMEFAQREQRVILTLNRRLTSQEYEIDIIQLHENKIFHQLKELISKGYIAFHEDQIFLRCLLCNSLIKSLQREKAKGRVPDFIYLNHRNFFECPKCQKVYWQGSHLQNMKKTLEELFSHC